MGSGGASVGTAVACNSRGPQFKSSHRQKFILNLYYQLYWKYENKEKEAGNGPFFQTNVHIGGPRTKSFQSKFFSHRPKIFFASLSFQKPVGGVFSFCDRALASFPRTILSRYFHIY